MDYNSPEGKEVLRKPLIPLTGKRTDFVKFLFFRIAYKKAKTIIYHQKEEIIRLKKREKNQTAEITRLQGRNKDINKELRYLKSKRNGKH